MKKKFVQVLLEASDILLTYNGKNITLSRYGFKDEFLALTEGAYYMPGMAQAKDSEIQNELQKGYWVEFRYDKRQTFAEFSFD